MESEYFDTHAEWEEIQRLRRQRMVKDFIDQQEEAVRPLLRDALKRDLEDLNIVVVDPERPVTNDNACHIPPPIGPVTNDSACHIPPPIGR